MDCTMKQFKGSWHHSWRAQSDGEICEIKITEDIGDIFHAHIQPTALVAVALMGQGNSKHSQWLLKSAWTFPAFNPLARAGVGCWAFRAKSKSSAKADGKGRESPTDKHTHSLLLPAEKQPTDFNWKGDIKT